VKGSLFHIPKVSNELSFKRRRIGSVDNMVLYTNATIVTVNTSRDVILDGAILVQGDKIADIGKAETLIERYPKEELIDLSGRIIIPGLITTHMHTAQTLLRGELFGVTHVILPRGRPGADIGK
jgi:cytosine/adenosine deaminase-related metal-dependent hydrolase